MPTFYGPPSDGTVIPEQLETALNADYVGKIRDDADTWQNVDRRTRFRDVATAKGALVDVEHNGDGSGNSGQTYGIDVHNNPGARSAVVVHQYSNAQPAVVIDNTDTGTAIQIRNTHNTVKNPTGAAEGTSATGNVLRVIDTAGSPWLSILGRGEVYLTPPADATAHALEVVGNAGSSRKLLRLDARGPGVAAEILAQSGSAGFYPLTVTGYDYGPRFTTSQNGSGRAALRVDKLGTGNGEAVVVINQGTGATLSLRTASAAEVAKFNSNGEYELVTAGAGILLRSPDGTRYRVAVADGGTLTAVVA